MIEYEVFTANSRVLDSIILLLIIAFSTAITTLLYRTHKASREWRFVWHPFWRLAYGALWIIYCAMLPIVFATITVLPFEEVKEYSKYKNEALEHENWANVVRYKPTELNLVVEKITTEDGTDIKDLASPRLLEKEKGAYIEFSKGDVLDKVYIENISMKNKSGKEVFRNFNILEDMYLRHGRVEITLDEDSSYSTMKRFEDVENDDVRGFLLLNNEALQFKEYRGMGLLNE